MDRKVIFLKVCGTRNNVRSVTSGRSDMHYKKASLYLCYLQCVREQLVHPCDLRGDAEVDRPVTDLDNQTTLDVRVDLKSLRSVSPFCRNDCDRVLVWCTYLWYNLELLALSNVLRFGNGGLDLPNDLLVKRLAIVSTRVQDQGYTAFPLFMLLPCPIAEVR